MLINQALESYNKGQSTAISFIAYKGYVRDYVKAKIPDVQFIHFKVDKAILLPKRMAREKKMMEEAGMSLEDMWAMDDPEMEVARVKYGREFTAERFKECLFDSYYLGHDDYRADEKEYCFTVNNNKYSKDGIT